MTEKMKIRKRKKKISERKMENREKAAIIKRKMRTSEKKKKIR